MRGDKESCSTDATDSGEDALKYVKIVEFEESCLVLSNVFSMHKSLYSFLENVFDIWVCSLNVFLPSSVGA